MIITMSPGETGSYPVPGYFFYYNRGEGEIRVTLYDDEGNQEPPAILLPGQGIDSKTRFDRFEIENLHDEPQELHLEIRRSRFVDNRTSNKLTVVTNDGEPLRTEFAPGQLPLPVQVQESDVPPTFHHRAISAVGGTIGYKKPYMAIYTESLPTSDNYLLVIKKMSVVCISSLETVHSAKIFFDERTHRSLDWRSITAFDWIRIGYSPDYYRNSSIPTGLEAYIGFGSDVDSVVPDSVSSFSNQLIPERVNTEFAPYPPGMDYKGNETRHLYRADIVDPEFPLIVPNNHLDGATVLSFQAGFYDGEEWVFGQDDRIIVDAFFQLIKR